MEIKELRKQIGEIHAALLDMRNYSDEYGNIVEHLGCVLDTLVNISDNMKVNVIGCNAATFRENYKEYIISEEEGFYDNKVFTLFAPKSIIDAIADLSEEGINIVS